MWLVAGMLIVLLAHAAPVFAAPESPPGLSSPVATRGSGVPPAQGRLRFKSAGPVCMCGEGLSEKDIERAMARQGPAKPDATEGRNREALEGQTPNGGVAR